MASDYALLVVMEAFQVTKARSGLIDEVNASCYESDMTVVSSEFSILLLNDVCRFIFVIKFKTAMD
jgi:hypothetical protein